MCMLYILFFFFKDTATTEIYPVLTHSFPTRRSSDLARDIQRDIAVPDHHRSGAVERGGQVGEIGVAVIPADECRRPDHAGQVRARNIERAIRWRAGRKQDRKSTRLNSSH